MNKIKRDIKRWGISSAGRAPALHAGGQRFDPAILHHFLINQTEISSLVKMFVKYKNVLNNFNLRNYMMRKLILSVVLGIFLISCANQTVLSSGVSEKDLGTSDTKDRTIFFLNGIFNQKNVVKSDCEEIKAVSTKAELIDVLVAGVSFGIITPRTYEIYCQ